MAINVPVYDWEHKVSTYVGRDMSKLQDELHLATESEMFAVNMALLSTRVRPLEKPRRMWRAVAFAVMPRVQDAFFYASFGVAAVVIFLSPILSEWIQAFLSVTVGFSPRPFWQGRVVVGILLDPILMHVLLGCLIVGVWVGTVWREKGHIPLGMTWLLFTVAALVTMLGFLLGLTFVWIDEVWKPILGLPRPLEYDPAAETPLVQFFRRFIHSEEGVPSGFTVRQTLLLLILLWSMYHPAVKPWRASVKGLVIGIGAVSVAIVSIQRYVSRAHDLPDILLAFGLSIAAFWSVVLVASMLVLDWRRHGRERQMILDVARMWLIVGVGLVFYGRNPSLALLSSVVTAAVLGAVYLAVPRFAEWTRSLKESRMSGLKSVVFGRGAVGHGR